MSRSRVLSILAGLVLGIGLPSVLTAASNELINITVDTSPLVAGQRFGFTIRLHDNGLATPTARMPDFDPRISLVSGPEISTETVVDEAGRQGRFVFMRYQARANSAGYAVLPAITVQYGVQTLSTAAVLLAIARQDSGFIPPDLVWKVHAPRLVRGQTVFISLELDHCPAIVFPETVEVPGLAGGAFEEVRDAGRIVSEVLAGRTLQSIPLTGFMFTPGAAGSIALPIARVMLNKQPIQSAPQGILVAELPAEAAGVSAIGDFKLVARLDSPQISQNGYCRLSVRVEGTGNLRSLQPPVPLAEGLSLGPRQDNAKLVPSESGYRGYREAVYQVAAPGPGSFTISVPPLPVLGLDGTVRQLTAKDMVLAVNPDSPLAASGPVRKLAPVPDLAELLAQAPGPAADPAWRNQVQEACIAYAAGDLTEAYGHFSRALRGAPGHSGLLYALGLDCLGRGSTAQAVFFFQQAARQAPWVGSYHAALADSEEAAELKGQIPVIRLLPASWMTYLLATAGVGILVSLGAAFLTRRRWLGTLAGIFLVLGLLAAADLLAWQWQASQPICVVSETGAVLKRIPEPGARDWLRLASGTSLRLVGRTREFILVETAYGIKGWVDRSALYLPAGQE